MALSLKDNETDGLAREVVRLTGESITQAVRVALKERLERERLKLGKRPNVVGELEEISRRYRALPTLDTRSDEDILGYDENGLPT